MLTKIYIQTISADRFTPLIVFKKLQAIALLESAVLEIGKSRYSLIEIEEAFRIVLTEAGVVWQRGQDRKILSKNPADYLNILEKHKRQFAPETNLSFPVPAGGIGYLAYEMAEYFDEIKFAVQQDNLSLPRAIFSFGAVFAIFDHYKDELHIVALGEDEQVLKTKTAKILTRLLDNDFRVYQFSAQKYPCTVDQQTGQADYCQGVLAIKQEIFKGNLLQAVLSRQIKVDSALEPLEAYRRLRRENPSPYLFYLNFGEFVIFGSSPEIMVQLTGKAAILKPIAGTRRRGINMEEDIALEKELLADPKERAEHLMLVDLGRNDLGRVAQKGTVKVVESFGIEKYSQVMHIVSELEAELAEKYTVADLIKATFPAGTVSGAPKIKAIEVLSGLEKNKRGPYAGLVGYFDEKNNLYSCITIRSAIYKEGSYYIQAGAGIVHDSVPEKEFQETVAKARATIKALGVEI